MVVWKTSMPSRAERYVPDHFLLFADDEFSFSLHRFIRTNSTEGWYFFNGEAGNIGTLLIVKERPGYWYVHGSFTAKLNPERFWPYLIDFLHSIDIHAAFVSVHTGGKDTICSDFSE
jgi:hypothetical protein